MKPPLRIAIAGLGTVGGGVVQVLRTRAQELGERADRPLQLAMVSARDRNKRRVCDIDNIRGRIIYWTSCAAMPMSLWS
jgi:homoserine dehydrogenase